MIYRVLLLAVFCYEYYDDCGGGRKGSLWYWDSICVFVSKFDRKEIYG